MLARIFSLIVLLTPLLASGRAGACSVPVFRYALEHWETSPYRAVVFRRGPLPDEARGGLRSLEAHRPPANVVVHAIDLEGAVKPPFKKLWERQAPGATLPWLVLQYPDADDATPFAWAGPLTEAALARVVDSPARRRVVEALLRGDSAVFVFLESGDRKVDDAAAALLERELARLEKMIELPEPTADAPPARSRLPLRVAFTPLRLSRADPAEEGFVRLLLHSEDDLATVEGPMVFPIFGRGRVLAGLHGDALSPDGLADAARFLCGACSCQVKRLNPGTDLLTAADWEALLDAPAPAPPSARPAPSSVADAPTPRHAEAPAARRPWLWVALAASVGLVGLTGRRLLRVRAAPASPGT